VRIFDEEQDISEQHPQKELFDKALILLQGGDARAAEDICVEALITYPDDANILCLSARALIRLDEIDTAEERLTKTRTLFPEFPRPFEILGELFLTQKRPQEAVEAFRRAIQLDSDSADTGEKLRFALKMLERTAARETSTRDPLETALADAAELERQGDLDAAERIYQDLLVRDTENVEVIRGSGAVAAAKGQFSDAEIFLQHAVSLAPDYSRAWADLAIVQMESDKYDEAVVSAERLIGLDSTNPKARLILADAYAMAGRYEDALADFEKVLAKIPDQPGALSGAGHMLKTMGRHDESVEVYRECVRSNPQHTEGWWGLANLKTYKFTDDEIQAMLDLLKRGNPKTEPIGRWLTSTPEVNLCNALSTAFEKRGEFDRAFEYLERGNDKRRFDEPYNSMQTEQLHDLIMSVFSREFLETKKGLGHPDDAPIFIVGLPRTGSTLLEQIIASHNEVDGTYELTELLQLTRNMPTAKGGRSRYPENVTDLQDDAFSLLGKEYIELTRKYRTGKDFFTDKNLGNFLHIGLIQLILPNAKIINARRHPLDTCLGCYKQLFARGMSFSYNLEELGEYYLQYQQLMDHWDETLPGKVLHVHYEDVVADLESQTRRILDHCDLPWDENCLRFHETERDVRTASSEQVRQPIYRSSVSLWRNYEHRLGVLIDILEPELRKLPQEDQPTVFQ
jgi:tetratricopeptide (TPR) repeat protein